MEQIKNAWEFIFTNIQQDCPKDTYNMVNNTYLVEGVDYYKIVINAPFSTNPKVKKPTGHMSYASAVNNSKTITGWGGRVFPNPNFQWVEKSIKRACSLLGGNINYDIQWLY